MLKTVVDFGMTTFVATHRPQLKSRRGLRIILFGTLLSLFIVDVGWVCSCRNCVSGGSCHERVGIDY